VRATVAASLVNRPSGGCVESVLTLATHRFVFRPRIFAPETISVMFEILDCSFVGLGGIPGRKRSEIAALAGLCIFLTRVKTILAVFQFSDHDSSLRN